MLFEQNLPYMVFKVTLTVICTLGMMCSTTKLKYSLRKIIAILSLYLFYVVISTAAIIYFRGFLFLTRVFAFTISLPAILMIYKLAKVQPALAVFTHATQILFSLYVTATVTLINTAIHGSAFSDFLLRLTAYLLIILLEFAFIRRPFLQLTAITQKGWGILSLIPCSLIVLVVVIAAYPTHYINSPSAIFLIYLLGAVIVIIYFAVFQYLFMQYRFQMSNHNRELLELQVHSLEERISEASAATEKARIDLHDTRHRLQAIASLVENEEPQTVLNYINHSISQYKLQAPALYCSSPILNATLSSYLERAAAENITLETHFSIPDTLPVDAAELSIVFANALENAITVCRKLPEEERKIICKCIHRPKLMLEVSNPYTGTVAFSKNGLPISEKEGHGIGTRSILAFCKKHDVFYHFTAENGWFTVTIVF